MKQPPHLDEFRRVLAAMTADERQELLAALNLVSSDNEAEALSAARRVAVLMDSKPEGSVSIIFLGEGA